MEEGTGAGEHRPEFSAFISYSHADAADVQRLHAKLEAYRLPKGLGRIDALNARRQGLGKVFRDREDLSAAENLSDAVIEALSRSQVLVVACSPEAKASRWVDQEIAYFRKHCPGRPILAAIMRGEPAEAFPAALTEGGTEPLAADLREEADGWKLGFLKVVAGIASVPLDALVQRDSQRQLRRVMAVTGVTALVAVAMGVMTMVAINARDEAQTLRQSGDTFIKELLTDGRQDLVGVGRLDVQDKFNGRALRFYERQGDPASLPSDSLINWASILHDIGEDFTRKGKDSYEKAEGIFQDAYSATAELMQRDADNPDHVYAHAQSTYWLGRIDELREDYDAAEKHYRAYRDFANRLAEVEPSSFRAAKEQGFGALNIGIMQFSTDRLARAGESFDKAIDWLAKAVERAPKDRSPKEALANARAWRFDVHYNRNEFEQALDQRLKSAEVSRRIVKDHPRDKEAHFSLLIAERAIALTRCKLGDGEQARRELARVEDGVEALVAHDPENTDWSDFLVKTRSDVARLSRKENCDADRK